MDEELLYWFEDRFDPDELVDELNITVEDLVSNFYERAKDYKLSCESEEAEAEQEGL